MSGTAPTASTTPAVTRFSTSKGKFGRSALLQSASTRLLSYTTTTTQATIWTLTLNVVRGGNASTSGVNPKVFPA